MDCWRLQLRRWALGKALQLDPGTAKGEKPRRAKCKAAGDFIAMNVAASRRTIVSLFHLGFVAFVVLENGSLIDVEPVGETQAPLVGRQLANENFQQCGFAGAVRANDRDPVAA